LDERIYSLFQVGANGNGLSEILPAYDSSGAKTTAKNTKDPKE